MSTDSANVIERITRSASQATVRLRVRSALNPVLYACGLITVPCISAAVFTKGLPQVVLLILGSLPVFVTCFAYLFLLFKDRDKLQSEEYQLHKRALDIIEEKGGQFPISATSLDAIMNPILLGPRTKAESEDA